MRALTTADNSKTNHYTSMAACGYEENIVFETTSRTTTTKKINNRRMKITLML